MPWNKAELLRQIKETHRRGKDRAALRELERLARQYGATWAEIARAKGLPPKTKKR